MLLERGGGGGGQNEQLHYQIRDKDRNEFGTTNLQGSPLKPKECHVALDNFARTSEA